MVFLNKMFITRMFTDNLGGVTMKFLCPSCKKGDLSSLQPLALLDVLCHCQVEGRLFCSTPTHV